MPTVQELIDQLSELPPDAKCIFVEWQPPNYLVWKPKPISWTLHTDPGEYKPREDVTVPFVEFHR